MPTLNWIGKEAVVNHHHAVPFQLLRDVPSLACDDPGSGNLIVQGDNLTALKALLPYYAGQVKCIYIDPPYNTGNEGWAYNDNVNSPEIRRWLGQVVGKEGETLDRHDRWLCMMYPRLALLRQFLREDGAIFVSIDDNAQPALRYLLDELFGAQGFISSVIWEKNYAPKASAKHLSENHDYVVIYAKDARIWERNLLPRGEKQDRAYKNPDNDPRGPWRPNNLAARNPYSLGVYSITTPSGRVIAGPPKGSYWRISKAKFEEMDRDGRIWWGKDGNNVPAPKIFLSEVQQGVVPMTIWTYGEAGHTQEAKQDLISILPEVPEVFITPKPVRLLERVIRLSTNPGDLVLDSFAGSGTTGHAVLKLNAAQPDKPARRFILVEMEPKIAREVTAERVRRVAQGYTNAKGATVPGLGGGFRFCELGEPLYDEAGHIRPDVKFADLARHVYFAETGEPLPCERVHTTPLLGVHRGRAVCLLYNGILRDKSPEGGNALTHASLAILREACAGHSAERIVVYGTSCRLSAARRQREGIEFKQIPYQLQTP